MVMMPQTLRSDTFSSLMCNVDATTHHNWIVAVFWTRPKMARWMESAEKPNVSSLQQCIFLKTQGTVYIPKFIMQLDNWTLNTSWEHGPTVQHYQHVPNSGGVVRATFILERTQLNLDVHYYKSLPVTLSHNSPSIHAGEGAIKTPDMLLLQKTTCPTDRLWLWKRGIYIYKYIYTHTFKYIYI